MPTQITIEAYKAQELEGRAQDVAYDKLSEIALDCDRSEGEIEHAVEELKMKGYDVNTQGILFSGFCSQGDGASFEASVNLPVWIAAKEGRAEKYQELEKFINNGWLRADVVHDISSRYVHSQTMDVETELDNPEEDTSYSELAVLTALEEEITEESRALADGIYRTLEKVYTSLISAEALNELADANGYVFDKYGRLISQAV